MNRHTEFLSLAARTTDPGYRRLWQGQAEYYAARVASAKPLPAPAFRAANEPAACVPGGAVSAWAALFDALGVAWEYEARFWLPDRAAWLKVLSEPPAERDFQAARALVRDSGQRVYMISGWPARKRFGVWVLAREGEVMTVRADFRDLALANLLGVSFERLYGAMGEVRGGR